MKHLKFTLLLALVLIAFAGSLRAEFLYVSYGKGLLSFSINRDTGAITELPGTPTVFAEGTGPLTLDRTGKLLYLSTGGSQFIYGAYSAIHGYRIAGNGHLIPLPGSPYQVTGGNLAVDPFNRFLYALNSPGYPNTGTVARSIGSNQTVHSVPSLVHHFQLVSIPHLLPSIPLGGSFMYPTSIAKPCRFIAS